MKTWLYSTIHSICTCKVRIKSRPDPDSCTQLCSVIQYTITYTGGGEKKLFGFYRLGKQSKLYVALRQVKKQHLKVTFWNCGPT